MHRRSNVSIFFSVLVSSRLFFQLVNVIVLILFGYFFLNFTLQHGAITFIEMVLLSVIMLFLLMGVGLIFSSIAKTDASIALADKSLWFSANAFIRYIFSYYGISAMAAGYLLFPSVDTVQ